MASVVNSPNMACAEPHANFDKHIKAIADAEEVERQAMEEAEAEGRRSTRKWRQYSVWLQRDSLTKCLPRGGFARRIAKAKLVWWASKRADGWKDIDRV